MISPSLDYPRITNEYIRTLIEEEKFIADEAMQVVICIARLKNGHRIIAHAITANRDNYNVARGKVIARRKVFAEITNYELYVMRNSLSNKGNPPC